MNNAARRKFDCWRLGLCALLLVLSPRFAWSQSCAFTTSNINFGVVSTISGAPADATGTIGVTCTGFSTATVRLCLSLGAPGGSTFTQRYLSGPSGNKLTANIYSDASHQTIWGSYYSSGSPPLVQLDLPVTAGSASTNVTMYGRIDANQVSAVVGSYTLPFTTNDTLFAYSGYTGTPPSCSSFTSPNGRTALTLSATVIADCNIVAAPLAFPAASLLNQPLQATSTVQVTCVSGAPYTVALDGGTTPGGTVAMRKLALQSGAATVDYQLYTDAARTKPWGDGTNGTTTNTGTGVGSSQSFVVYGVVPAQTSQPAGKYSDTITATVSF
ncbi:spore coat U domain-containing protein [Caballeronia sp. LZ062]|uniref:Csu type fimbrial protein n=1 Tax=unclassified Caballeronia TaxID=2646786 RepID=UPI00285D3CE1|nr:MULTISPECIES: spore coat U domain-containing protein [unclassified Caballeronia]MDR5856297.1 spore coat U domain-containing protein [Caballeronia sp. LZ050]MDR5872967.1 spore coat U domain-containing protein [Caballeronia sp. LZ062]